VERAVPEPPALAAGLGGGGNRSDDFEVLVVRFVGVLVVGGSLVVVLVREIEGDRERAVLEPVDDAVGGGAHGAGEAQGEHELGEDEVHRGS